MKKTIYIVLMINLFLSSIAFSQQEPGQNSSDLAAGEHENVSADTELPKFLVGINFGVGGCWSTMPSRYEEYVVAIDPQNDNPKSKAVTVFQFALSSYYFFSNSLGLKFEIGYATYGGKQQKEWSNAEIYYTQTGFKYIQFQIAPVYRTKIMYFWLGLNIGLKIGTPKFHIYDSLVYDFQGDITKAKSSFVGLTVGWGALLKTGGVYFPVSLEFKYNLTTSGLNLPYGTDQNQRFYAIMVNIGILFNL